MDWGEAGPANFLIPISLFSDGCIGPGTFIDIYCGKPAPVNRFQVVLVAERVIFFNCMNLNRFLGFRRKLLNQNFFINIVLSIQNEFFLQVFHRLG